MGIPERAKAITFRWSEHTGILSVGRRCRASREELNSQRENAVGYLTDRLQDLGESVGLAQYNAKIFYGGADGQVTSRRRFRRGGTTAWRSLGEEPNSKSFRE